MNLLMSFIKFGSFCASFMEFTKVTLETFKLLFIIYLLRFILFKSFYRPKALKLLRLKYYHENI